MTTPEAPALAREMDRFLRSAFEIVPVLTAQLADQRLSPETASHCHQIIRLGKGILTAIDNLIAAQTANGTER